MRTPVRAFSLFAVAGLLAALAPAAVVAQTPTVRVGGNTRIGSDNDPVRGRDVPGMAVNPADPGHIVLVNQDMIAGQCEYHSSFDGGRTWTDGDLAVPPGFTDPPCRTFDSGGYTHINQSVAFGSGQNVYTTFSSQLVPEQPPEDRIRQGDSILVARSTDGGRTFGTAVVAIRGSAESQPYYVRPGIAVEPRPEGDRLYVSAWGLVVTTGGAGGGPGDRRAVVARSDDAGATWAPAVDAQAPGEQVRETTEPVVASDGTVYVGWRNRDPAPATNNISVGKSTDRGVTWTQSRAGVVTGTGISNNGGFPRLDIDRRTNTLYLVYQGLNDGDIDIFFQRSTDGAATWSAPKRVNDDQPNPGKAPQLAPHLAVAPDGRVDVVWFDGRGAFRINGQDPASRGYGDVYLASTRDGGQTFSPNRRITDRSLNNDTGLNAEVGSYIWYGPGVAAIGTDQIRVAWADPRLGGLTTEAQDIYTAVVDIDPAGPPPSEELDKLSPVNFSVLVSQMAYPGGAERVGRNDPSKLVVVNEDDTAGALIGSVLARGFFGPLLLSPSGGLTDELKDEVARFGPAQAYVLGDEEQLSAQVQTDLEERTMTGEVVRLGGSTPAEMAKAAAEAMDLRGEEALEEGDVPAFDTAVVVNPSSGDAAAGAALAASLRAPILFAERDSLPAPTSEVLTSLDVPNTLVVGGPESISDNVMGQLPGARRLGGDDPEAVSLSAAREMLARGLPSNLVYVADASRPRDQAVLGAAVSRLGGLMVATPGADAERALEQVRALRERPIDRVIVARSSSPGLSPFLIGASILLGLVGIGLLVGASLRARRKAT